MPGSSGSSGWPGSTGCDGWTGCRCSSAGWRRRATVPRRPDAAGAGPRAAGAVVVLRRAAATLVRGQALDGRGKRAAFALYYAPLHFLTVREHRAGAPDAPEPDATRNQTQHLTQRPASARPAPVRSSIWAAAPAPPARPGRSSTGARGVAAPTSTRGPSRKPHGPTARWASGARHAAATSSGFRLPSQALDASGRLRRQRAHPRRPGRALEPPRRRRRHGHHVVVVEPIAQDS